MRHCATSRKVAGSIPDGVTDIILPAALYDMIYLLTAIGLTPGGSSTVHIYEYIQTIQRTTQ